VSHTHTQVGGRPTGAVRASLGALSTFEEAHLLLRLLVHYFVEPGDAAGGGGGGDGGAAAEAGLESSSSAAAEAAAAAAPEAAAAAAAPAATAAPSPAAPVAAAARAPAATAAAETPPPAVATRTGTLTHLFLYPIKSCAAQVVSAWPLGPTGLLYDREWALVDDSGSALTQKACARMATLQPEVRACALGVRGLSRVTGITLFLR
jgi:hypothetical protein